MGFYTHNADKKTGDGLALTDWNNLSSAVGGNQGLTLARSGNDKVGIGMISPNEKLEVNGNAIIGESGETLKIGNVGHSDWAGIAHKDRANGNDYALIQHSNGSTIINSRSGHNLHFRQGNADKMVINNGNVGIGTTSPAEKLDVNGKVKATHFIGDGSQLTNLSVGLNGLNLATQSGNVGIGTTSPGQKLEVAGIVKMTGADFLLDSHERRNGQSGGTRRALVHDFGDKLTINYAGDYTGGVHIAGGVRIGGGTSITRIIAGNVFANSNIAGGTGFTCVHDGTGEYTVTFNHAFPRSPVVVATCTDPGDNNVVTIDIQMSHIKIFIHDVQSSGFSREDGSFSFIAIGL